MRRFAIGIILTAVSVGLLVKLIAWESVWGILQSADERLIALAVLCLVLSLVAKTARWRLLLPDETPVPTPRRHARTSVPGASTLTRSLATASGGHPTGGTTS